MLALTVVKNFLRKATWTHIYSYTQVNVHTLVTCVFSLVQTKEISIDIWLHTQGSNHTHAPIVSTNHHEKNISLDTYAHTQGRNQSPVMCVELRLFKAVIWNVTKWLTQGRKFTRWVTWWAQETDIWKHVEIPNTIYHHRSLSSVSFWCIYDTLQPFRIYLFTCF